MAASSSSSPCVAIVTGGAAGIGRAFTHVLLARGYSVVVADIAGAEAAAHDMNRGLPARGGGVAVGITADVTKESDLQRVFKLASSLGRLALVCNNAGIARPMLEDMQDQTAINLVAVMHGTKLALDAFTEEGGIVVNTASVAGLGPVDFSPVYAASKAGVVNFTRSLGWLRDARGVRVCAICPNFTDTAMVRDGLEHDHFKAVVAAQRGGLLTPERVAQALTLILDSPDLAGAAVLVTADKGCRVYDFKRGAAAATSAANSSEAPRAKL